VDQHRWCQASDSQPRLRDGDGWTMPKGLTATKLARLPRT